MRNKLDEFLGDVQEGEVRQSFTDMDAMLSTVKENLEKYHALTIWHIYFSDEKISYIAKFLQENHIHFIDELNGFWCFRNENDLTNFKNEISNYGD